MPAPIRPPRPNDVYLKGAGFDAVVLFAEKHLGPERGGAVTRKVEAETGPLRPHRLSSAKVPLEVTGRYFSAFADALEPSFDKRVAILGAMGQFVAEHNLGGVFKAVLSFVGSPDRLARRMPSLWITYFPNVVVDMDVARVDDRELSFVVRGLESLPYINAIARGWLVYAFQLVGASSVEVREQALDKRSFTPNAPLAFTIRWA